VLLWTLFWWWRYTCPIKETCCHPGQEQVVQESEVIEAKNDENRPMLFQWSDYRIISNDKFETIRDSLAGNLTGDDQLEITGQYFRDEENNTNYANLGLARAAQMRDAFVGKLDTSLIKIKSSIANVNSDLRNRNFEALSFKKIINNEFIKEIADKVLIYFPFNSTKRFDDPTISEYLGEVAKRARQTNEKVLLIGHSDSEGTNESNYYLGLWRAGAVRDILVNEKGLPENQVIVESKGELEPIGSNNTSAGRKQNRRVELKLIQ
jgi:outer membrane protein OmpA-like peptidoglycan-associated protein